MWLAPIGHLANANVLKRNNSAGLFVSRELEVIEAIVVEDEPAALPRFVPPSLLPEPPLAIGVEECVHQIVTVIFRDLERLGLDALVQTLKKKCP